LGQTKSFPFHEKQQLRLLISFMLFEDDLGSVLDSIGAFRRSSALKR